MPNFFLRLFDSNLKKRALQSSIITFATYGTQQGLRLVSNLVLTRLLFPEAFGVMAVAMIVATGISMLSDVGIGASIIQNPQGHTTQYRNTAWVVQIIRGFLICIIVSLIAYPISLFYEQPVLFPIICLISLCSAVEGFKSTSLAMADKELNLLTVSLIRVVSQIAALLVTIIIAYIYKTVWALAWGTLTSSALVCIFSHIILNNGFKHRLELDRASLKNLINFGKWILLSSTAGFLANQADKIVISKFLSLSDLGVYVIASTLAGIPIALSYAVSGKVLFPLYSKFQDSSLIEVRKKIYKARVTLVLALLPLTLLLILFGSQLVDALYDPRYESAGWMLQCLAVGAAIQISTNIGPFFLSFGKSRLFSALVSAKAVLLIMSMIIGGYYWGTLGLVAGVSCSSLLNYIFERPFYHRYGLWFWRLDLPLLLTVGVASYLAYLFSNPSV